jgi:hypothetical protein
MSEELNVRNDDDQGDAWLNAYPERHREMLAKLGVPSWMNERADAHNRRLIALVEAGVTNDNELAALAEQSFNEHFGGMLAAWAEDAEAERGDSAAVRHVDLNPLQQVSVANGIGHVMRRFRRREVAALAGFTIDPAGNVRLFGGGQAEEQNVVMAAEFLGTKGLAQIFDMPAPVADPMAAVGLSPGVTHTRNPQEQQAAVARAVREVRRRYRDGEIEVVIGFTVDQLGRVRPFGGGESGGPLIEDGIEALKEYVSKGEKRYDQ